MVVVLEFVGKFLVKSECAHLLLHLGGEFCRQNIVVELKHERRVNVVLCLGFQQIGNAVHG